MNRNLKTLYDIEDGDRFVWQGRKYTLVTINAVDDRAVVIEDGVDGQQNFNPYARVLPLEKT